MVKIHVENRSRKDLLKNQVNIDLMGGLYTTIVNSVIWRNQYNIDRITSELHEFGREIGMIFYPLLSKELDAKNIDDPSKYVSQLWNIIFSKKPDSCKWDKTSSQLILTSNPCMLCQNLSEQVSFPFSEAIAGLIEVIVEFAVEDIKGRFSSHDISCRESECSARDGTSHCKFILSISDRYNEGETPDQ
jgi:predicted hydrocarbon binding protein